MLAQQRKAAGQHHYHPHDPEGNRNRVDDLAWLFVHCASTPLSVHVGLPDTVDYTHKQ